MSSAASTATRLPPADEAAQAYDVEMKLPEGGRVRARRRVAPLRDGLVWIEEDMEVEGRLPGGFVTGPGWLFEWHQVREGTVWFVQDDARVPVEADAFGVLYAPFSITCVAFEDVKTRWVGVAGTGRIPGGREGPSVLFEVAPGAAPANARELLGALSAPRAVRSIERRTRPSALARGAKALLDASYRSTPSIASLAAGLRVSHAHLTRQFKRDYGLSPVAYRHRLRASEAIAKLSEGERIVDVAGDVGYEDLGRFYKAFRRVMHASPGQCRL
jgi:AraC-like DNA-binding protein